MTPGEFVAKWRASQLTERAASQSHFNNLCAVLHEPTPTDADPSGDFYAFEKGAEKTTGGDGFADVWLKDHFGWEYKGKRHNLQEAYKQLLGYHEALLQPPLLVVCDLERFEVHTKFPNTEAWIYTFHLEDILNDDPVPVRLPGGAAVASAPKYTARRVLKLLFEDPTALRPNRTTDAITQEAVAHFQPITAALRGWTESDGKTRIYDDMRIARFVMRLCFCMFATDIGLLPPDTFSAVLTKNRSNAQRCRDRLRALWRTMSRGGDFDDDDIPWFNGELFDDDDVPEHLTAADIERLCTLDAMDWAYVEPAIFGTLFERILNPQERARLGAHYTSREDVELLIRPVLMEPLEKRWEEVRTAAIKAMDGARLHGAAPITVRQRLREQVEPFLLELASISVLDPACGSGNFLYVALASLKKLEKEVVGFAALHDVHLAPQVGPHQLHGIELNPYAHEIASMVIWIGYLQWKYENLVNLTHEQPILEKLAQVELKDAVLDLSDPAHPREATWPRADVIVGNPPFLGGKFLRNGGRNDEGLGDAYVDDLFAVYDGRVRRESDLCCYWFEKARGQIADGKADRAGLLATQAIRGGANRDVLQRIKRDGHIFFAVDDREWVLHGATVHVSMVGFDGGSGRPPVLLRHRDTVETGADGKPRKRRIQYDRIPAEGINADLTALIDLTAAKRLPENAGISFMGDTKVGPFDIPEGTARQLLASPNPDGRSNRDVVRPWANGLDITGRPRNMWIIDFPPGTTEAQAAGYEAPFKYVVEHVKAERLKALTQETDDPWWVHHRPRPGMRAALSPHSRYVATPNLTKYRFFTWRPASELPDHQLIAFARSDDYFFGVLQSRPHTLWALAQGTQLRDASSGARYTPTTCFETFPLPWPPGSEPQDDRRYLAIADAARELNAYREGWLNPPPADGIPLPESELRKRTLTNLYNEPTPTLQLLTRKLDEAVFAAYDWPESPAGLSDQEILSRLLALNLSRAPA